MNIKNKKIYDYYGDSKDIFSILKDYEWPVYLCSNYENFKNQRYDIMTCSPIEKIYAHNDNSW